MVFQKARNGRGIFGLDNQARLH